MALTSGREIWTTKVGSNVFSSPVATGDALYVGVQDGQIVRLALRDGTASSYRLDERIYATPWIEEDMLIITVNDGTVRAFAPAP